MGKVLWHITMSIDGFVAGPRDDMTWLAGGGFGADSQVVDQVLGQIGAILMGRRTYHGGDGKEGAKSEEGAAYGGAWQGPQFVLTRDAPEMAGPGFTFLDVDAPSAVAMAQEAAGGTCVAILGPTTAKRVLQAGLLDEMLVHVAPLLLGDGIRHFDQPGGSLVKLQAIDGTPPVTNLRFRATP